MEDYIPEILSSAFSLALYKKEQIAKHGVTPDMSDEAKTALVKKLADEFMLEHPDFERKRAVSMLTRNVDELVKLAGMSGQDRLDTQYRQQLVGVVKDTGNVDAMAEMLN
jgi:hypothetical protein